jgi:multidrug efflux system membrane fusion protein
MNYTQAQVETDRAMIAETQVNLNYCDIRSPIDGITGIRKVDPGNIVPANTGPVLVNVRTVSPLYVDFSVPDRFLAAIRASMGANKLKVIITANEVAFGVNSYEGELRFLNNSVNNNSGTILLRATVPNKENRLWAGQFVKVRLIFFVESGALLAPTQAVKIGKDGPYLFVIDKDGKAQLRQVDTWIPEGDYTVIKKGGLKKGDLVVTVGQMALAPGDKVKVIKNIDKELSDKPENNTGKVPDVHILKQPPPAQTQKKPTDNDSAGTSQPSAKKEKTTVKSDKKKDAAGK